MELLKLSLVAGWDDISVEGSELVGEQCMRHIRNMEERADIRKMKLDIC